MPIFKNFNLKVLILFSIITTINFNYIKSAKSFIPSVYEPSQEELNATATKIGQTAAQLLYFGEIKKASQLGKLAVDLNPNQDKLWALLAEIHLQSNNLEEARSSLNKAKLLNPNNSIYLFAEANIDFLEKKIKKSVSAIEKGLSMDPNNPGAYFQLGNAKLVMKEFPNALKAFKKANKIKPNFWQSLNNQGLVLYEMGEREKAIEIWKKTIIIKEDAEPILALAAAKYSIGKDNSESFASAKKALIKNPNYVLSIYQKEQLWGNRLCRSVETLFKDPEMSISVEKALENVTITQDDENDSGAK